MKKYFVVSDVHGFYNEMMHALNEAGFDKENPDHIFVSCGDLLDRGSQPLECLRFVLGLAADRRILVRGNHETLMEQAIARGYFQSHDYHNGTHQTAMDLTNCTNHVDAIINMRTHKEYNEYWRSLVQFYQTENYVFVHGWVPCIHRLDYDPVTHFVVDKYNLEVDWENGDWEDAEWVNGMNAWYNGARVPNKTVVCGHFHTSWGHKVIDKTIEDEFTDPAQNINAYKPFTGDGIIAIDACTAYSGIVNCVVIEDNEKEND